MANSFGSLNDFVNSGGSFGSFSSGQRGASSSPTQRIAENRRQIQEYQQLAKRLGVDLPDTEPKPSLLDRVLGFMSMTETAPAVMEYVETKDPNKALKKFLQTSTERATMQGTKGEANYADVLEKAGIPEGKIVGPITARGIAGLTGDIIFDPMTYLGGKVMKEGAERLAKPAVSKLTKLPKVGPRVKGIMETFEELFTPLAKSRRASQKLGKGDLAQDIVQKSAKTQRYKTGEKLDMVKGLLKEGLEEGGEDVGIKLGQFVEEMPQKATQQIKERLGGEISEAGVKPLTGLDDLPRFVDDLVNNKSLEKVDEVADVLNKAVPDKDVGQLWKEILVTRGVDSADDAKKAMYEAFNQATTGSDFRKVFGLSTGNEALDNIIDSYLDDVDKMWKKEFDVGLIEGYRKGYVQHALTKEARDFLHRGGDLNPAFNQVSTALKSGKKRELEGIIKEINEEFGELVGGKVFEPDLFKAWINRSAESIRRLGAHDMLTKLGEEFGVKAPATQKSLVVDGITYVSYKDKALKGGMIDISQATPEGGLRQFLASQAEEAGQKVPAQTLLPEGIVKDLKESEQIFLNDEATNKLLKTYDNILNKWKTSVTGGWPAFHGRNALGGSFMNAVAGVTNPQRYFQAHKLAQGADEAIELGGKTFQMPELLEELKKRGLVGGQGYLDVMQSMEKKAEKVMEGPWKKAWRSFYEKLPGTSWMEFIEDRLRGALVINELDAGKAIDEAVDKAFKFHFDYSPEAMSRFERNVMRRVIPFYVWTKNNVPLQLMSAIENPGKYAGISKLMRQISKESRKDDMTVLPEYMRQSSPIKMGESAGKVNYLYGLGIPIEDLSDLSVSGVLSKLSPLLKVPLEVATDKHFYFDKPISENFYAPDIIKQSPKPVQALVDYRKEETGDKTYHYVNPIKMHVLSQAFSRAFWTSDNLVDPDTSMGLKFLYATLGLKGKAIDPIEREETRTRNIREEMAESLYRQGAMKRFQNYYR